MCQVKEYLRSDDRFNDRSPTGRGGIPDIPSEKLVGAFVFEILEVRSSVDPN
jgi:hypothetical protein